MQNRHSQRVTTEGDELYFELRGIGRPLLMIPGGGDGGCYSAVGHTAEEFSVGMLVKVGSKNFVVIG